MDERIIEKLQKLLALAGSDNENEASVAMLKAETLMREHNLSIADVAMDGSVAMIEDALIQPTGKTKTYPRWEFTLANVVAMAFNGRCIYITDGRTGRCHGLHFVAGRVDMLIILDLFERLRQTIRRQSAAYVKQRKPNFRRNMSMYQIGQSYRAGMIITISSRLEALRCNTSSGEGTNAYGMSGKELIIVKKDAIQQRITEKFGNTVKDTRRLRLRDEGAYLQGMADGKNVSLHQSMPEGESGPVTIAL